MNYHHRCFEGGVGEKLETKKIGTVKIVNAGNETTKKEKFLCGETTGEMHRRGIPLEKKILQQVRRGKSVDLTQNNCSRTRRS